MVTYGRTLVITPSRSFLVIHWGSLMVTCGHSLWITHGHLWSLTADHSLGITPPSYSEDTFLAFGAQMLNHSQDTK